MLEVALMSYVLSAGNGEQAQHPHLIWVVLTTFAHVGNYVCNVQTDKMHTAFYKHALVSSLALLILVLRKSCTRCVSNDAEGQLWNNIARTHQSAETSVLKGHIILEKNGPARSEKRCTNL